MAGSWTSDADVCEAEGKLGELFNRSLSTGGADAVGVGGLAGGTPRPSARLSAAAAAEAGGERVPALLVLLAGFPTFVPTGSDCCCDGAA